MRSISCPSVRATARDARPSPETREVPESGVREEGVARAEGARRVTR